MNHSISGIFGRLLILHGPVLHVRGQGERRAASAQPSSTIAALGTKRRQEDGPAVPFTARTRRLAGQPHCWR